MIDHRITTTAAATATATTGTDTARESALGALPFGALPFDALPFDARWRTSASINNAASNATDTAIIRIEQLYPLAEPHLAPALQPHPAAAPAIWVQEEPQNMGAWRYLLMRFGSTLCGRPLSCVARRPSASPATGSEQAHKAEQTALIDAAFGQ